MPPGRLLPTRSIYLGRMAPASARGFLIALNNIAEFISNDTKDCYELDWAGLTYQDTAGAREGLAAGYATRTANYGLCALRGVLKECWRLGLMTHKEFSRATELAAVRGNNSAAGRVLTVEGHRGNLDSNRIGRKCWRSLRAITGW